MTLLYNAWGDALTADSFSRWQGNGVQLDSPYVANSAVGERVQLVEKDESPALRIQRFEGDAEYANHPARSQLLMLDEAHIADWVAAGETGADADEAYRWYRMAFLLPSGFDTSYLLESGAYATLWTIYQRFDTSPADTGGAQGALALRIRKNSYGRLRYVLVRMATATTTQTGGEVVEIVSWPYRTDQWQDVLVYARWSYTSLAEMTVWLNRRPILVESGVLNCSNNAPSRGGGGLYPIIGVTGSNDVYMDSYHRGIIVGDKLATFADMYPELDGAVPLERVLPSLACLY